MKSIVEWISLVVARIGCVVIETCLEAYIQGHGISELIEIILNSFTSFTHPEVVLFGTFF